MRTVTHWIGGQAHDSGSQRQGDVFNPATGEVQAQVALAAPGDVDTAVAAARAAFAAWSESSLSVRTRVLFAFRDLLARNADELAAIVTAEHGKVLDDARGEVQRGLEVVEFACGIPHLLKGGFSDQVSTGVDTHSLRQPLGVVAGITPFNFPVMVPLWMHPVAVACGNTFVLKPSDRDPSASGFVAELYAEAGLPDGVFNVVHGDAEAVNALLTHPDIAAVSFVGSTPIARHVYETASGAGKRVQALGGAKNHMVVMPDADIDLAADAAVSAAYGSAGERCMAISAVVAVGSIADELVEAIGERAQQLRIGPGDTSDVDMGPLITAAHRERVAGLVQTGLDEGAELRLDGRKLDPPTAEGFWLGPCLLDHVTADMTVYTEEIFGPVLVVLRAPDLDAALKIVNDNPYGNGTAIFTASGGAARRYQRSVQVGMVGINVPIPVPMAYYSFGGWKDSLFGGEHVHGTEGVQFYTRGKVVTSRWPETADRGMNLSFPANR